jgi:hypothetical protein
MNEKRVIVIVILLALVGFGIYTVSKFEPDTTSSTINDQSQNGILPSISGFFSFI